MLIFYYYIPLFLIFIALANRRRKERTMGPRIQVSAEPFTEMVNDNNPDVVHRPKQWIGHNMYIARIGDYYYFCTSADELQFVSGINIKKCKDILI
jgi:hypothetical protein